MNKLPYKNRSLEFGSKIPHVGRGRGAKMCIYCHKPKHIIDVYFKKHKVQPYLRKENLTHLSTSIDYYKNVPLKDSKGLTPDSS